MTEPKFTFYAGYVDDKRWDKTHAAEFGYVLVSEDFIKTAKNIVHKEGARVKIDSEDNKSLECYLFGGNLVIINPFFRSVPLWGQPCIEPHSETEEGLEKLTKNLGLPYNPSKKK